jgi:hypothetical protein
MGFLRGGKRTHRPGLFWLLLSLCAIMALAGCSSGESGSGGINFSLGLAGSTADQQSQPPTIASGGPNNTYAFVYDNQIWVQTGSGATPKQLTQLVLSNGATLRWGPLTWSPDGKYIAFALVEDLNLDPHATTPSAGPIYYVSADPTAKDYGTQYLTPGTGSVYGHTYDWFGSTMLLYSNGSGIQVFTLGSSDPRAYQVRTIPSAPFSNPSPSDYYMFGDIRFNGNTLYYTRLDIRSPGRTGSVGTAGLFRSIIGNPAQYEGLDEASMSNAFPITQYDQIASLGLAYADSEGNYVAGAWQLRNGTIALQSVQSVDNQTVTSKVCTQVPFGNCGSNVVSNATKMPITVHPQIALGPNGKVAYCADNLYVAGQSNNSGVCNWTVPPVYSSGGMLAFTQLTKQATDANGAERFTTNIQVIQSGGQAITLIAGAQNLAFKP